MTDNSGSEVIIDYSDFTAKATSGIGAGIGMIVANPGAGILDTFLKLVLGDGGKLGKNDADNVRRILEAGREQGVARLELTMSREEWLGLKSDWSSTTNDSGDAFDAKFGRGGKTDYRILVEYK